jgi:N-acyl-L-homoserine lactone synthetase
MAIPRFVSSGGFPSEVRRARTQTELRTIWALRYQIYVEEYGRLVGSADHGSRLLRDSHDDSAIQLMVASAGEVVACARLHLGGIPHELAAPLELWRFHGWSSANVCYVSKFMIRHDHRRSTLAARLMRALFSLARERQAQALFCVTFSALVPLYERAGMAAYGAPLVDADLGTGRTMVLLVDAHDTLRSTSAVVENGERPVAGDVARLF